MSLLFQASARFFVALVIIAALFGSGYVGGWPFFACIAVMTVIAMHEYYSALPAKNIHPNVRLGVFCSLALLVIAQLSEELRLSVIKMGGASLGLDDLNVVNGALHMTLLVLLVCVAGTLIAQFRMREGQSQVANAATTVFGVVYVGLLFSFALHMRYIDIPTLMGKTPDDVWAWDFATRMGALAFIIGPVWLSDSMAFLTGNLWGRIKLAPTISPGKTLEGALGGLLGAVVGALVVGMWLGMNPARAVALGVVMGTVGPLGDLGKSVLKRDLGIKDFGTIFGPHGGVLDRFDAILFSMPLIYWYFWFLVMASP